MYGKLAIQWQINSKIFTMKLKSFFVLLIFAAFFISCSKKEDNSAGGIEAQFAADNLTIKQGGTVQFTDLSSGYPVSWEWTFEGGNPASSMEESPRVSYLYPGAYRVSLTVSDASSEDTEIKEGYIVVELVEIPDEFDIVGTWERIESNYTVLDGIQVSVTFDEMEGIITKSHTSQAPLDGIKWKNIVKLSEHEYVFDDLGTSGDYFENTSMFILAYGNELIVGNFNQASSGSFQRWRRIDFLYPEDEDYSLASDWERLRSNNTDLDGMEVQVGADQESGSVIETPDEVNFPLGALKWQNIVKEGPNRFQFDDLATSGTTEDARMFMVAKGSELLVGVFNTNKGSFQQWKRK